MQPIPSHNEDSFVTDVDNDRRIIRDLVIEWATIGWRQLKTDPPFNFRDRLGRFYDWSSEEVRLFETADPERRIRHSAAEYAAVWDRVIPALNSLGRKWVGEPDIIVSGDLAAVNLEFISLHETMDGQVGEKPVLSSLVLRRSDTGWHIVREHGTSLKPGG